MASPASETMFAVDAAAPGRRMARSWEVAVGAGDAWSLLRADLQQQLARAVRECGFQYLRCHGILCEQLQSAIRNRQSELVHNWRLVDAAYDALLDCGLRPFVELGFMPPVYASGEQRIFYYRANVTPPADYAAWNSFIGALVSHWRQRYGAEELRRWYFEVWNEPNLPAFWSGTQEDYYRLYIETARTVKAVDPELRLGGPATTMAGWLREFVRWCGANGAPLDFVATHVYPDDDQFEKTDPNYREEFNRGGYLEKVVRRAYDEVADAARDAGFPPLPTHWTEWNSSWRWGRPIHDATNQAAYICRVMHAIHEQVDSFAYWTISDIFNEFPFPRSEFVGGFGLITIGGVPKPGYHAYQLLHRLGDHELPAERRNGAERDASQGSLDCWAAREGESLQLLLTNYTPPGLEGATLPDRQVRVELRGLRSASWTVTETRVDPEHANGRAAWEAMGAPEAPTPDELQRLRDAAELRTQPLRLHRPGHDTAAVEVALPPSSAVLLEIQPG